MCGREHAQHASRARDKMLCHVRRRRHPQIERLRERALGEVVGLFEAVAADDQQRTLVPELLERELGMLVAPPASPDGFAVLVEVAYAQWAFRANPVENELPCFPVDLLGERWCVTHPLHARQRVPIVVHGQVGGSMGPVLECFAVAHETVVVRGVEVAGAGIDDVLVCAAHDRDRVHLNIPEVFEHARARAAPAAEALAAMETGSGDRDATQAIDRNLFSASVGRGAHDPARRACCRNCRTPVPRRRIETVFIRDTAP